MAYGKARSYASRRKYGRGKRKAYKPPSARKTNVPIARTLKRKRTPQTRPARNTRALYQLSRQVKSLQLARAGSYQKSYQYVEVAGTQLKKLHPLIFTLNDFTVYGHVMTSSIDASGVPQVTSTYTWQAVQDPMYQANLTAPQFSYWANAKDDYVSDVLYRPIQATITFDVFDNSSSFNEPEFWVRVDVVKQRKIIAQTPTHNLNLPWNASALGNMATQGIEKNRWNKEYFSVIMTKWIKITKEDFGNQHKQGVLHGRTSFKFNFPAKTLKVDADQKLYPSAAGVDGTPLTQDFETNIPQRDKVFVVINSSLDGDSNHKMVIRRFISWRDLNGVAA